MSFTVFLGNLPVWVTADDIKQWLSAEDLVADSVKVIRNHETQESKGFAFVEAPTQDEMQAIIRRFDRAPLEDKVLRANPAQPSKGAVRTGAPAGAPSNGAPSSSGAPARSPRSSGDRPDRRSTNGPSNGTVTKKREQEPKSAFATELAKVL
jgi:RNA recognition motif-containing protein